MFGVLSRLVVLAAGAVALTWVVSDEMPRRARRRDDTDDDGDAEDPTLADAAAETGPFGTFHVAAKNAGLMNTLEQDGPFTVFAPTDDAFAALGERIDELLASPRSLGKLLKHHIVKGEYTVDGLAEDQSLTTLAGTKLKITGGHTPKIGDAQLVEPDVVASNGLIQGIDQVLELPATSASKSTKKKSTKKKATKKTKRTR